ncbi:MAG TPA: uroporphyrinogen decarboxylase family protein, partial [Candidatus Hydrogenedentes bacterium]|nr:uroporphyrinogen decarboxylase family protein [Candidatus Hydrogenedentota bacterium]
FIDDLADAGADGFIFEPLTSLERAASGYGKSKSIAGSFVDCRTLTFGTPSEIQVEVDATLRLARACPGLMFAVGNHIPSNVPVENALFYLSYLKQHGNR